MAMTTLQHFLINDVQSHALLRVVAKGNLLSRFFSVISWPIKRC